MKELLSSDQIRARITRKGWTATEAARELGLSRSIIDKVMKTTGPVLHERTLAAFTTAMCPPRKQEK